MKKKRKPTKPASYNYMECLYVYPPEGSNRVPFNEVVSKIEKLDVPFDKIYIDLGYDMEYLDVEYLDEKLYNKAMLEYELKCNEVDAFNRMHENAINEANKLKNQTEYDKIQKQIDELEEKKKKIIQKGI